jgi:hypothetical protein
MRHIRPVLISFALAACVATTVPAFATPVAQSPVSDVQIELASGGYQRCWIVPTPWGPQRRCRGGGWRGYGRWGGYGGYGGYGGWGGGGYGYRRHGEWGEWGDRD